jgi:diguanylate cyclase (GGDEF)-like protein
MWAQIESQGSWEGEVWNRRKNGEIYPELLNVVSLRDPRGKVLRYAGLFVDLTHIKSTEEKIRQMAYVGNLTGVASRGYFMQHLGDILKSSNRRESRLALLFIDLDGFKNVNDSHGHEMGDRYLKIIAGRLKKQLRDSDFIARLGGDEFCIIIENVKHHDFVVKIVRNCLEIIKEPLELEGQQFIPQASIGIAFYPEDAYSEAGLLKAADKAMYTAKKIGRHRYEMYNGEMSKQVEMLVALEYDLQLATERNQFVLHYQPKVDLDNGQMMGVEALIRWQHPQHGLIMPDKFITLAEKLGVIDEIGLWVLETACKQLINWQNQGIENITMLIFRLSISNNSALLMMWNRYY